MDSKAHTDEAYFIALTPDDKHAVTAAFDGTVRLWDVKTGELLQRFYLPKAAPNGARLRALAMAPDGQRVAVTGWGLRRTIMVVSLQTGRIEQSIVAPEDSVSLAWSRDGRFIAAGKPGGASARGVRVYDVNSGAEVFRDTDFLADVASLEFRADGAFFASTWDGRGGTTVKLYLPEGTSWRMAARKVPRWGDFRNRWDADGKTVLIGAINRLDGQTLDELPHDFDRRGLPNSVGFSRVAQSPDGQNFFGTTWSVHHDSGYMRRWRGTRRSDASTQLKLPDPRIADLAVTRKGEVVYLSDRGAVAMVDADFKLAWRVAHDAPNLDRQPQALRVTESGLVSLPVGSGETERAVAFNLADPEFVPLGRVRETWKAPATSGAGIRVLAWEGTVVGTVNDAPLPVTGRGERSLSVAVHSTQGALALGTNWERLYKVSAKGERVWVKYLGSDVVGVNLIESRDLLVAATANGLLWLFRWSDGAPVMRYYLQPLSRRWLAISTPGYYEASTGAEDLAGWIVNPTQPRVADFMPMSRFRSTLLLTGLGRQAWTSQDESQAVKALLTARGQLAEAAAVGSVAVAARPMAPASSTAPASTKPSTGPAPRPAAEAPVPAAPVAAAVVPAATVPPVPPATSTVSLPAPAISAPNAPASVPAAALPSAEVSVAATEAQLMSATAVRLDELPPRIEVISPGFEFSSDKRTVQIRFKALSSEQAPVTQLRTMISSATVSSKTVTTASASEASGERELTLEIPAEDTEIRLVAENRYGASVPTVLRINYTGPKQVAGKGNLYLLVAGLSRYENAAFNLGLAAKDARDFVATLSRQRGVLYGDIFLRQLLDKEASKSAVEAGFQWLRQNVTARDTVIVFFAGHGFNDGPGYYFMTHEADLDRLASTAVPFQTIRASLASLPGRVVVFVDTCHSGNAIGKAQPRRASDPTVAINDLASSENGLVVFASSTGEQLSQEDPAWGNGAFTKAVVEGLQGAADFKKRGRVTYKGLDAYVADRVDELTKGEQTPVTPVLQGVPDFTLAEVRR